MAKNTVSKNTLKGFTDKYQQLYGPLFKANFQESTYEAHRLFALHAVFPAVFTADLLYQIWFNFRVFRGKESGRLINLPNFVVSDFLLSGMCRSVGYRVYAVEHEFRQKLLNELEQDSRFGRKRMEALAALLNQYNVENFSNSKNVNFSTYHSWLTEVVLDPEQAAAKLASELSLAITQQNQNEIQRLTALLKRFAESDSSFKELATVAEAINTSGEVIEARSPVLRSRKPEGASWEIPGPLPEPLLPLVLRENDLENFPSQNISSEADGFSPAPFVKGENTLFALLIGVNEYVDPDLPPLEEPINSVNAWESFLQARLGNSANIWKLANATLESAISMLREMAQKMKAGDGLLLFFSGHSNQNPSISLDQTNRQGTQLLFHDSHIGYDAIENGLTINQLKVFVSALGKEQINVTLILDTPCADDLKLGVIETENAHQGPPHEFLLESDDSSLHAYPHTIFETNEVGSTNTLLEILRSNRSQLTNNELVEKLVSQPQSNKNLRLHFVDGATNEEFLFGALKRTEGLPIKLIGSDQELAAVRKELNKEPYIADLEEADEANYQLIFDNADLYFDHTPTPLNSLRLDAKSETSIALDLARRMASWERTRQFNYSIGYIPDDLVLLIIELYDPDNDSFIELNPRDQMLELPYTKSSDGSYQKPKVRIKLSLNLGYEWPDDVYVSLLMLDQVEGQITNLFKRFGGAILRQKDRLGNDDQTKAAKTELYYTRRDGEREVTFSLPEVLINKNVNRVSDYFKLFVSNRPLDVSSLEQSESLTNFVTRSRGAPRSIEEFDDSTTTFYQARTQTVGVDVYHPAIEEDKTHNKDISTPNSIPTITEIFLRFVLLLSVKRQRPYQPLEGVAIELSQIKRQFEQSHLPLEVRLHPYVRKEALYSLLNEVSSELGVLHFSSQDTASMSSSNENTTHLEHLANVIKTWEIPPPMIFLNGCLSAKQVNELLAAGVKNIIATRLSIDEKFASEFTNAFYQQLIREPDITTIKQAVERASLSATISAPHNAKAVDLRGLMEDETLWDWGLFSSQESSENLSLANLINSKPHLHG